MIYDCCMKIPETFVFWQMPNNSQLVNSVGGTQGPIPSLSTLSRRLIKWGLPCKSLARKSYLNEKKHVSAFHLCTNLFVLGKRLEAGNLL